jgi:DNA-binding GntR family transcriptional regulator
MSSDQGRTPHNEVVYLRLRQELLDETIKPGTRPLESSIAERPEVNRTPVRAALQRLQSDGFVQRVGPGRLVATPTGPDDLGDVGLLRIEIDGLAARLAAARATAREWEQLRASAERIAVAGSDPETLARAHMEFHRMVYAVGFGPRMSLFVENHVVPYLGVTLNAGPSRVSAERSSRDHLNLLRSLSSGDIGRAEAAARTHAESGLQVARTSRPAGS